MKCGIIENNSPKCPRCLNADNRTLKVIDVDTAKIDDVTHFELVTRCRKCNTSFYYFLNLEMFERKAVDKKSDRYGRITKENFKDTMEENFDE